MEKSSEAKSYSKNKFLEYSIKYLEKLKKEKQGTTK